MPRGCFQTGPGLGLISPQRKRRPHRSPARVGDILKMATPGLLTLFRPEPMLKKLLGQNTGDGLNLDQLKTFGDH